VLQLAVRSLISLGGLKQPSKAELGGRSRLGLLAAFSHPATC